MIPVRSLDDLSLLRESVDLECKLAAGRDGTGAVPEDFWPTYCALANTAGGVIALGLREKQGQFEVAGIQNIAKVRKELRRWLRRLQTLAALLVALAALWLLVSAIRGNP